MFEGLDAIPWAELTHAYGSAEEVPTWLRRLRSPDADTRHHALRDLWGSICHQNWNCPATGYAVPYLIELLADPKTRDKDKLLDFLADIATCAPLFEPEWRENDRLPTWNVPARIPVKDAHQEAEKGIGVYLGLLEADDAKIRMLAANLLTAFPGHSAELRPALLAHFQDAKDQAERANALLALGRSGSSAAEDVRFLQGLLLDEQNELICFAAAVTQIAKEQTPQEVADLLAQVMECDRGAVWPTLSQIDDIPCGGEGAPEVARDALYALGPRRMRFLLPYLRKEMVSGQGAFAWTDTLVMLLYIIFDGDYIISDSDGDRRRNWELPRRPVRPLETLTSEQREILTSFCSSESEFRWANRAVDAWEVMAVYGLPHRQKELADYLGIPLPFQP